MPGLIARACAYVGRIARAPARARAMLPGTLFYYIIARAHVQCGWAHARARAMWAHYRVSQKSFVSFKSNFSKGNIIAI